MGVGPTGHGTEAVRVGRIQSVSAKGEAMITPDSHIMFLIEQYKYIEIIHLLDIFSFLV